MTTVPEIVVEQEEERFVLYTKRASGGLWSMGIDFVHEFSALACKRGIEANLDLDALITTREDLAVDNNGEGAK